MLRILPANTVFSLLAPFSLFCGHRERRHSSSTHVYINHLQEFGVVWYAVILPSRLVAVCLQSYASVVLAELTAIITDLDNLSSVSPRNKSLLRFMVCSLSIQNINLTNPLVQPALEKLHRPQLSLFRRLLLVPSHVRITSNKEADRSSKSDLRLTTTPTRTTHFLDCKIRFERMTRSAWLQKRHASGHPHLRQIKDSVDSGHL